MANQLGFYYRPKLSTGKFYNITEKVLHNTLTWSDSTANELLEFTFDLNLEPLDDSNNPFTMIPGDEIVITEDENRNSVFRNLTGIIINPGQESIGSWDKVNSRGDNRYSITVRQKDFSKSNVTIEYKEPVTLNNLLIKILENTDGNLAGIDANGNNIAKFVLSCPNVDIASADFKGREIDALNSILTPLGYNYRLNYLVVKDSTLLIKRVVAQLNIFQKASPPITSTFALGISNQDINYGMIANPSFDPYDLDNKPYFLLGERDFKVDYDFDSIVNQLTIIGLVQDGVTLKKWERKLTGNRTSDFNLGYKYKDIIFVARFIESTVSVDTVPAFSPNITFSINQFDAEKIENYDQVKADFLVCRIVHDSVQYFYKFTISSGLITLGALAYGSTALPEALSYGDVFELVKSVTIYEDNREFLEGYGQYGVIKNVALDNSEATLKFLEDDIPRAFDTVISYGYKLEPYLETHNFYNSQKAYGIRPSTEEIDFPLTLAQLQNILTVASENSEPAIQISFTTLRPEEIVAGWEFPVNVTGRANGIFTVTGINCKYICASGEQGKHLVESQVNMGIKRDSLQDTLSGYRKSYETVKTIMSRGNEKDIFSEDLFLDFGFSGSVRLPAPTGLTLDASGATTATLSWDAVSGTRVYHIYLSDDGGATWLPGYGSGGLYDVFVVDLPDPNNPLANLTGLTEGVELTAYITAEDLYGESALSGSLVFTPSGIVAPDAPVSLSASSITGTTATLTWATSVGATSYKVYASSDNFSTFLSGYNGKAVATNSDSITILSNGTNYKFKVKATNTAGDSPFSSDYSFITIPATPTGLAVSTYANTTATVTWNTSTGATSYKLYIKLAGSPIAGYNGKVIASTSENVTGLLENTTYTIEIIATNASGDSALSGSISFKTKIHKLLAVSNEVTRNYYYTYNTNASNKTRVSSQTTYAEGSNDAWARISPNGRYVAYSRPDATSTYALYVYDLQLNTDTRLSAAGSNTYGYPAWNPSDPTNVYCWKNFGTGSSQLVKLSLTPTTETVLVSPATPCYELDFSNNGLYALARIGTTGIRRYDTTNWATAPATIIAFSNVVTARYNTDNSKILYSRTVSGYYQVHDCNPDGSSQTQRTTGSVDKYNPCQQKVSPFDITYNFHNSYADFEIWKMTSSYASNAVFIDSSGNNDSCSDWGLVQF